MGANLKQVVHDNQRIFDSGHYVSPSGAEVELASAIEFACAGTRLFLPSEAQALLQRALEEGARPQIEVTNESTAIAARRLIERKKLDDVVALNFASARNPGGGYLNGARAQEEQLCRTSALYPCLLRAPTYYEVNRAQRELLYTDHAIYSPRVPFFRDEALELLEKPFALSVITSPAPNAGALHREQPELEDRLESALRQRAGQVLAIAQAHGHRTLVLGAWGCGAFGNDPVMVAEAFASWLDSPRFQGAFTRVVFAVLNARASDERNLTAFQERFARG